MMQQRRVVTLGRPGLPGCWSQQMPGRDCNRCMPLLSDMGNHGRKVHTVTRWLASPTAGVVHSALYCKATLARNDELHSTCCPPPPPPVLLFILHNRHGGSLCHVAVPNTF